MMAMNYGYVYVAKVSMGANDAQTVRAFLEAEAYDGPSLIVAYSHCIAHGFDLRVGTDQQKAAVESGYWPLFRYHPENIAKGENPLHLDSKAPKISFEEYAYKETRYNMLAAMKPALARELLQQAEEDVKQRWQLYEQMASIKYNGA